MFRNNDERGGEWRNTFHPSLSSTVVLHGRPDVSQIRTARGVPKLDDSESQMKKGGKFYFILFPFIVPFESRSNHGLGRVENLILFYFSNRR